MVDVVAVAKGERDQKRDLRPVEWRGVCAVRASVRVGWFDCVDGGGLCGVRKDG